MHLHSLDTSDRPASTKVLTTALLLRLLSYARPTKIQIFYPCFISRIPLPLHYCIIFRITLLQYPSIICCITDHASPDYRCRLHITAPYNMLALHCTALHCTALHCTTLHFIALKCVVMQSIALQCTTPYLGTNTPPLPPLMLHNPIFNPVTATTVYTVHCTLHTAHFTLHTTHYTLHTAHYAIHTELHIDEYVSHSNVQGLTASMICRGLPCVCPILLATLH